MSAPSATTTRRAIRPLATRLHEVKQEVGTLERAGIAEEGFAFVTDQDVMTAVRELLLARHIDFKTEVERVENQVGNRSVLSTVWVVHRLVCVKTGEEDTTPWVGSSMDGLGHGVAQALTSSRKTFLLHRFSITIGGQDPEEGARRDTAATRTADPVIPVDRATRLLALASQVDAKLVEVKLADLGATAIETLTVHAAEDFEAWLTAEGVTA